MQFCEIFVPKCVFEYMWEYIHDQLTFRCVNRFTRQLPITRTTRLYTSKVNVPNCRIKEYNGTIIDEIPQYVEKVFHFRKAIDLSQTQLKVVIVTSLAITQFPQTLVDLSISSDYIRDEHLAHLKNLRKLCISRTTLTCVPQCVTHLKIYSNDTLRNEHLHNNLIDLTLYRTAITRVPESIVNLNFRFNEILDIPRGVKRLDCLNSQISDIEHLQLEYLNCVGCGIKYVPISVVELICDDIKNMHELVNLRKLKLYPKTGNMEYVVPRGVTHLYAYGIKVDISHLNLICLHIDWDLEHVPETLVEFWCDNKMKYDFSQHIYMLSLTALCDNIIKLPPNCVNFKRILRTYRSRRN
jgi:hypothetical protein